MKVILCFLRYNCETRSIVPSKSLFSAKVLSISAKHFIHLKETNTLLSLNIKKQYKKRTQFEFNIINKQGRYASNFDFSGFFAYLCDQSMFIIISN